jgi:two-component system, NtrC family, sensor histidine kinase PilS
MAEPRQDIVRSELFRRIQTLMFMRILFVSLLLGASIVIQVRETRTYFGYIQNFHFFLLAAVFLLTFIYVLILRKAERLLWFAYLQLLLDTLFITAIIYSTGGTDSIFSFLYLLTIINAGIILYKRGAIFIASASSILFGLLLDLQLYGWVHPLGSYSTIVSEYQRVRLFYLILVNMAAFYLVAFLSAYLSEQTRKSRAELKAKQIDFDQLEVLKDAIINSIDSGLIALDDHDRVILFNPAAEAFFGIEPSRSLGMPILQIVPVISAYLYRREASAELMLQGKAPFVDFPFERPDQMPRHLRLSVSPLRSGPDLEQGHILVFQDMTTTKKIEQEMKKVEGLALIGELAAGIAHEIRNPMASISGSIQLIKGRLDDDDINSRLMEIVLREIKRLNRLVNDFLLFARPKKIKLRAFNLDELIMESLELFQNSQHWDERIRVSTGISDGTTLVSDPELVKQVLWNLFVNAFEAMPDGGSLQILARRENNGAALQQMTVRIEVRDTGKGFDDWVMPHLFTPFWTTKEQGSGLGLAIVKRVVDTLHGRVFGENHPDGGAQVTILLPSLTPEKSLTEEITGMGLGNP